MINWWSVITNSFWIVGLALLLAAFSYSYWVAGQEGTTLRRQLERPAFLRLFTVALVLVGIGLAGTSQSVLETALAVLLIIGSALFYFTLRRQ
jgi:hypothetical protein